MVPFFQVWPIKQIIALFLFSALAYYRANWIHCAMVLCGCVGMDVRVWLVCVLQKKYVCL